MRFWWLILIASPLRADITGFVRDEQGNGIAGARVRVQTTLNEPAITDAAGAFTLTGTAGANLTIAAGKAYEPGAPTNYLTTSVLADDGDSGVVIVLPAIPEAENPDYLPIKARTPSGCGDCHTTHLAEWETSRHADTAQNEWVNDLYAAWNTENPGETGFCASCHAPVADVLDPGNIFLDQLSSLPLSDRVSAREGVNCASCHQIDHVNDNVTALHLNGNATMRFPLDGIGGFATHEYVWGPLDDVDYAFMKTIYSPRFRESEFCASCHEYANPENGTPAQTTYSEWLASPYGDAESMRYATCQDCHMPRGVTDDVLCDPPIGFGNGPVRPGESHGSHAITGTSQAGLAASLEMTVATEVVNGRLAVIVGITNAGAGHSFPTGVSIRNGILRVLGEDTRGAMLVQTDGSVVPFYGSDGDAIDEEGDWAGLPGKGFAKVMVDGVGNRPVLFIDAVGIDSDTRIPAGETDETRVVFNIDDPVCNGAPITLEAILTYRRAWRETVATMGWTTDNRDLPWELELKREVLTLTLGELARAMWGGMSPASGFDTDGSGRLDIIDILALDGCP